MQKKGPIRLDRQNEIETVDRKVWVEAAKGSSGIERKEHGMS